jgi:PAS domain S-box-containing protein
MTRDARPDTPPPGSDLDALLASELFLEQLLANDHLIVALKDRAGRYQRVSKLLERLWGSLGVDVIGKTAREALPGAIGETVHRDDCAVLQTQQPNVYEQTFTLHGIDRTFLTSRFILRDAAGQVAGLCVVGGEITERKRYEQALRNAALGVSGARGGEIYRQMVRFLATTLGVDLAFVSTIDEPHGQSAQALAVWHRDRFLDSFDYDLAGTPCATVVGKQFVFIEDNLGQRYPADLMMIQMGLVSYAAYPLFTSDGRPLGLIAISDSRKLRDRDAIEAMLRIFSTRAAAEIERERAEAALRASEQQYRVIFNSALDGMLVHSLDGRLVDLNPAVEQMYGASREEMLRLGPRDLMPASEHPALERFLRDVRRHAAFHAVSKGLRRDGRVFDVDVRGSLIDYHGAPHLLVIVRDITDSKLREAALAKSEERFRTTVEAALDCIVGMDAAGRIIEFNPAAEACFGYRSAAVLGQPLADLLIPERQREAHRNGLAHHLATGEGRYLGRRVEVSALRADGSAFPAELTINCAQGPNGPLYIGYLRDITDLKRAESERERLAAQLRQAQKMEAIGHLAGGIAHDFNNILTSILGYTVMAEEQAAASENSRLLHHLEQIRYAGERARDLIAQLLTFSRGERGAVRPIDPRPLVTETVKLFGSTFPSSVRLRLELGGDVPPALCDPVQFEQVLVNLCINARDAIGGHGEIVITLRRQGAADLVCTACRQPVSGEFVELAVLDDGHGIPPGLLDRIFEPFFTTKPAGAGSGMGLATTHGIVHEHGGHIVVESPPAGGTLFRVLLPPAASTRTAGTDASTEQRGGRPRKVLRGHVLLVEDEASVRGFMREFLESRGYSVSEAVDGQAALDWFAASASPPDAVLTDQSMPRLNGIEFARALRRHGARVPVLLYSGHGEPLDAGAAAAAGISGVLNKPLDLHELVERLAAAIAR